MCDANNYMTFFSQDFAEGFAEANENVISYKDIVKWLEQEDTEENNKCEEQYREEEKKEAFERMDQEEFDQAIVELANEEKEEKDNQLYLYLSQYQFVIDLCDNVLE